MELTSLRNILWFCVLLAMNKFLINTALSNHARKYLNLQRFSAKFLTKLNTKYYNEIFFYVQQTALDNFSNFIKLKIRH